MPFLLICAPTKLGQTLKSACKGVYRQVNKEIILSVTLYMKVNGIEQLCVSLSSGSSQAAPVLSMVGEYTSCQRTYWKTSIWKGF